MRIRSNYRKAQSSSMLWIIVILVLLLTYFLFSAYILKDTADSLKDMPFEYQESCRMAYEAKSIKGLEVVDKDDDGLADDCDSCVCISGDCLEKEDGRYITDNSWDDDKDGVPKGCDIDDLDKSKGFCEGSCKEGSSCGSGYKGKVEVYKDSYIRCVIS